MNIPVWIKPAAWGAVVGGVVVAIVGFTWGGWVTGGSALEAATEAADESRADLAAAICVQNFLAMDDARAQLSALQDESSFQQRQFVEAGGWAVMPDREEASRGAATLCARMLAALEPIELPVVEDGEVVEPGEVIEPAETAEPTAAVDSDADAEPEDIVAPDSGVVPAE